MDVELALKINRLVHNECKDVPHDIGLRIEELVRLHQSKLKNCSIPDVMVELPDYDFYCVECGSGSNNGICPKCNKKGN